MVRESENESEIQKGVKGEVYWPWVRREAWGWTQNGRARHLGRDRQESQRDE